MQDCENRVSADRITQIPSPRLQGEAGKGDRTRAAGRDAAQGKNMPPSQAREGGKLRLYA